MKYDKLIAFALLVVLAGCRKDLELGSGGSDGTLFELELPSGLDAPFTPAENPLTDASVRLGKALFFEPGLSRDGTVSCASCHHVDKAFSDGLRVSVGVEGRTGMRNAPSLGNVGYHSSFFRDGGVPTLEQQVIAPVHDPVEMDHDINLAARNLRDQEPYRSLSMKAYGKPLDAWVITRAIANYERTLISGWSRYDRFLQGDQQALTDAERNGLQLFQSAALNCTACHSGQDLSDHDFHNVGQYMDYGTDPGRERITLRPEDNGKFKTPSLRNVALTAPYMHDGTMATIEEVIDHFASGGLPHPQLDAELRPFAVTTSEMADLIAFLNSLTDQRPLDQVR